MGLYWIQKRSSSANLRLRLLVFQQSQIHKTHLILSSSALPWFHTGRVRISVVWLISLHCQHWAAIALQPQLAHPPPISWPCATTTTPPSINSKSIFRSKPCQNRHTFEIFRFFMHWACTHTTCTTHHYAVAWGDYLHAFVHLCTPLRALSAPSVHLPHTLVLLFTLHLLGLSPLSNFPLTSDPLPATMGNPALVQLGTVPIPDLCITKSNPCGPHVAHLPSLWACTTHIAIQGSGPAGSPVAKAAPIFHCGKPCNRLANYSIPWPMGREILLSGQDSDLSSLGAYEGSALRGG